MKDANLESSVAAARALGHHARLRIVAMLRSGELCVCQITEVLGFATSTVSAHLRELRQAGLVAERKDGRWVHFSLDADENAAQWINAALSPIEDDPQLESDRRKVEEIRKLPVEDLCRLGFEAARARAAMERTRRKEPE